MILKTIARAAVDGRVGARNAPSHRTLSLFWVTILLASVSASRGLAQIADETPFIRLYEQFLADEAAGRYREGEAKARRLLQMVPRVYGNLPRRLAIGHHNIATCCFYQSKYQEAEAESKAALPFFRQGPLGTQDAQYAASLNMLGNAYHGQARYPEAEKVYKESLTVREALFGPQHADVAESHLNLGSNCTSQGRYPEAEAHFKQAVEIFEVVGDKPALLADSVNNLALLYETEGLNQESEAAHRRSLKLRQAALPPTHPRIADSLNNLANLFKSQGRYAEAEPLYKQSLEIRETVQGVDHPDVADSLNNLANVYQSQSRFAEAEPLYLRSLKIYEQRLGPKHPRLALPLGNLSSNFKDTNRLPQAEQFAKRALQICEAAFGPQHLEVAESLAKLASIKYAERKYDDALQLDKQSLDIREKILGADSAGCQISLNNIAIDYREAGNREESLRWIDRLVAMVSAGKTDPNSSFGAYHIRARLSWDAGDRERAVQDLQKALVFAETSRKLASGGEQERAQLFAGYRPAFERMVSWQAEMGNIDEAFQAAERGRARSLVDQMQVAGVDLLAGVPPKQARKLRRREAEAMSKAAGLEKQIDLLTAERQLSPAARATKRRELESQLVAARANVSSAYQDIRNASPAYHLAIGKDPGALEPDCRTRLGCRAQGANALFRGWRNGKPSDRNRG